MAITQASAQPLNEPPNVWPMLNKAKDRERGTRKQELQYAQRVYAIATPLSFLIIRWCVRRLMGNDRTKR